MRCPLDGPTGTLDAGHLSLLVDIFYAIFMDAHMLE
jgi:hypothetical protein